MLSPIAKSTVAKDKSALVLCHRRETIASFTAGSHEAAAQAVMDA